MIGVQTDSNDFLEAVRLTIVQSIVTSLSGWN
jgi:hypothetical protein